MCQCRGPPRCGGGEILDVEWGGEIIDRAEARARKIGQKPLEKYVAGKEVFARSHARSGPPDLRSHLGHKVGHLRRSGARSGGRSGEKTLEIMGLKDLGEKGEAIFLPR